ncbi:hypothetical protein NLX83_14535 [Allokutzneria sp. A3M-2-11 16]|uniref:hypothetical protein n=1 Tax=Allokutzneria sp. A3M-2-11 16 TaxID=2962043 RepID=UPI0020B8C28A|nr:hypothetical protein [Allokutzneria sp. A3M-2-11 16]MCP3800480.1 hypothetical protein [Allokutzneria sp. A3M-2-11 16]
MAIPKGHRLEVPFDVAFPQGLVLVGELAPDDEYQENRSKPARQKVDAVTDQDETKAERASFQVTFLADVQPGPVRGEVLPGMRPVELGGLAVEPRVSGSGELKYQGWLFWATGFKAAGSGAGKASAGRGAESKSPEQGKAA